MIRLPWRLVASLPLLAACGGAHHRLPAALPPTAPVAARAAMYREHRPVSLRSTVHYQRGTGAEVGRSVDSVALANGLQLTWPEDLLPLVGERSPTAERIHGASRLARNGAIFTLASTGVFFGGLGVMLGGVTSEEGPSGDSGRTLLIAGGVMALVGLAAAVVGGTYFSSRVNAARREVFLEADPAMRARLRLCGEEPQLFDCDTGAPAPAPPPEPTAPMYAPEHLPPGAPPPAPQPAPW